MQLPWNTLEMLSTHTGNFFETSFNRPWNFLGTSLKHPKNNLEMPLKDPWNTMTMYTLDCLSGYQTVRTREVQQILEWYQHHQDTNHHLPLHPHQEGCQLLQSNNHHLPLRPHQEWCQHLQDNNSPLSPHQGAVQWRERGVGRRNSLVSQWK